MLSKCWDDGLCSILWPSLRALEMCDMKTHMYPFMVAAVGDNSTLTTVYELTWTLPELVTIGIPPKTNYQYDTLRAESGLTVNEDLGKDQEL
eukprot:14901891-Ditylum_brightwellii.AAC.1